VLSRALSRSTPANFSVKRKACFSDTSSGSGTQLLQRSAVSLSACQAATNQATTPPRLTRSPASPHATADRGLFSPSDPDSQLSGCRCRCRCCCHCSQELLTDQWRSPPGPREGNLGIRGGRTDLSQVRVSPLLALQIHLQPYPPHSSSGSTHPPSPACCSCHSRPPVAHELILTSTQTGTLPSIRPPPLLLVMQCALRREQS